MVTLNRSKSLSAPRTPSRWLAAGLFLLAVVGSLAMCWLTLLGCDPFSVNDAATRTLLSFVLGPIFGILGSLIFIYRPQNRIGWLCFLIGFSLSGSVAADLYAVCGLRGIIAAPGKSFVAWFLYSYGNFPVLPLVMLLPMVYPTGRFLSERWRWAAVASLIALFITGTAMGLNPDLSQKGIMYRFPLQNPLQVVDVPPWWPQLVNGINNFNFVVARLLAIAAIMVRFRRSVGDERQQMKWLAYCIAMSFGIGVFFFNIPTHYLGLPTANTIWFAIGTALSFLGIPIIIGIAIFKYRLYAIDLIINRTLVYGGLTLLITAVYLLLVGGAGLLAANQSGHVIGMVLATGIVVFGARPLHRSLQVTADRFVAVPNLPPVGKPMNKPTTQITDPARPKPFIRWIALVIWALIVLAHLTLFVFDLNVDFAQTQVPCAGGLDGGCNWAAISAAEKAVLASWGLTMRTYAWAMIIVPVIILLVYWTLAALILRRQGTSWLGLSVSLALIVMPISINSTATDWTLVNPNLIALSAVVVYLGTNIMLAFLYLMPNGRFSPKWAYIPLIFTSSLMGVLQLESSGIITLSDQIVSLAEFTTTVSLVLFGGGLQIYRYLRDSTPIERQQTKWIILGIVSFFVAVIPCVLVFDRVLDIPAGQPRLLANIGSWYFNLFALLIVPVAITIAILRYKLWNIDIVINRTLVYGGLTAIVVALYTLFVVGSSRLFQNLGDLPGSLMATGLIALIFQPARQRLQRTVNRLMFGQRDDPYAVLSHLSQQLQTTAVPSQTLTSIVQTIATTLKLPYAAIELVEQDAQVGEATVGRPLAETIELPLRYQNEQVGRLLVSPRSPGEKFTPQEEQLLADIAAQTGPVASATRLTLALQRSREQLVLAREEERRRIRRDLHDGLGPTLASQTLKLDMVLELLNGKSTAAVAHVAQLKGQTQQMVADIRRLVYELRPPALDELGLLEALRSHVAQMSGSNGSLQIAIEAAPEPLPPLPAAIEVAAYRIALEAVTNVIRHAQARTCCVRFVIDENQQSSTLVVTGTDDGVGLPTTRCAGVGLISMRERAAELGGTCMIGSNPNGGTRVTAVLPFTAISQSKSVPKRQGAT